MWMQASSKEDNTFSDPWYCGCWRLSGNEKPAGHKLESIAGTIRALLASQLCQLDIYSKTCSSSQLCSPPQVADFQVHVGPGLRVYYLILKRMEYCWMLNLQQPICLSDVASWSPLAVLFRLDCLLLHGLWHALLPVQCIQDFAVASGSCNCSLGWLYGLAAQRCSCLLLRTRLPWFLWWLGMLTGIVVDKQHWTFWQLSAKLASRQLQLECSPRFGQSAHRDAVAFKLLCCPARPRAQSSHRSDC